MEGKKESILMKCTWNTTFVLTYKGGVVKRETIAQGMRGTKKVKNRCTRANKLSIIKQS